MIHHVWTVLCQHVLTNQKLSSLSYINTLSSIPLRQINNETGELTLSSFSINTKWFHDNKDTSETVIMKFSMKHSSDEPDIIGEHKFGMEANTMFAEFHMDVSQMKLKKKGLYFIVLEYKVGTQRTWRKATQIPVLVDNKKFLQQDLDQGGTAKQEKENVEK